MLDNKHVILNRNSVKGLPTDCRALNMDVVVEEIEKGRETSVKDRLPVCVGSVVPSRNKKKSLSLLNLV